MAASADCDAPLRAMPAAAIAAPKAAGTEGAYLAEWNMGLVQAGIGIAIVPESAKHLRLEQVEFRNLWREDVVAEIYLVWRRIERNPAQQRLRELIIRSLG